MSLECDKCGCTMCICDPEWCEECQQYQENIDRLLQALHDAITRPKGVVPDSALEFYDPNKYMSWQYHLTPGEMDEIKHAALTRGKSELE